MSNYIVSDTSLGSVADAIRTKGGTSAPLTYPQGFIDAIDAIETGGSGGGDTPIPDDGKTRIFISIAEETPDNRLTFYLRFTASVANNTTVDWGDGTSETLGSTTATNYSHKYSQGGDYVITMTVNTGTISFVGTSGTGASAYSIYGNRGSTNLYNRYRIKKVIFGDNISEIGTCVLNYASCVALIIISSGITSIGVNAFNSCSSLMSVTIPDGVTNIGNAAFGSCSSMSEYHFKSTTPPTLVSSDSIIAPSDCIIYVPQGSLDAYKTATNWATHKSKIQEEPT